MDPNKAIALAKQGFRLFPIIRNTKRPAIEDNLARATTDPRQISAWAAEFPGCNFGIATGGDVFVIDADVKDGRTGLADLTTLQLLYDLPDSLTVETPSGGRHLYLAKAVAHTLVSNAGKVPNFPGLDIRAEGGFVVAPGSAIDGVQYRIIEDAYPATAPAQVLALLRRPLAERIDAPAVEIDLPQHVAKATGWLIDHAPTAVMGSGGDETTFSVAAELRALGVSEHTALDLMLEHWNEAKAHPPWTPEELAVKVENAFRYGQGAAGGKTAAGEFDVLEIEVGEAPRVVEKQNEPQRKPSKLHFLTYAEMCAMPEPEWLVEDIVQKQTSALLFGKSNTFKSFLAIDIGLSVATGRPWHGRETKQGRVLFVATEGANGVGRLRVPGWYDHYGVSEADRANALLFPKEICLDVKEDVEALVSSIRDGGPLALLVLDIFGGTMAGTEVEDTTARSWSRAIQHILRSTGTAVLTVAHTGWQDETRARMHTHFWGSFDSRMRVEGDKDKMTTCLTIERHKDADSTGSWGFDLVKTHGTLVPNFNPELKATRGVNWSPAMKLAMQALDEATQSEGVLRLDEGFPAHRVAPLAAWKAACARLNLSTSDNADSRRKAFDRARDALRKADLIEMQEDFVWSVFGA